LPSEPGCELLEGCPHFRDTSLDHPMSNSTSSMGQKFFHINACPLPEDFAQIHQSDASQGFVAIWSSKQKLNKGKAQILTARLLVFVVRIRKRKLSVMLR
jgi:hypothetical protein